MTYTSGQVSAKTGATLRQLQWWDERGILKPLRVKNPGVGRGKLREYSEEQLQVAYRIMALRRQSSFNFKSKRGQMILKYKGPVQFIKEPTVIGGMLVVPHLGR